MKMLPGYASGPSMAVPRLVRNVLLPTALILASLVAAPAASWAVGLQGTPEQYPSPRDHLDESHRAEFMGIIEDGDVTEEELGEAVDYERRVRIWADQVSAENPADAPEAHKVVIQATWLHAAVQEAIGMAQTSNAVTQDNPRLVGDFLRRGFDDQANGSALNWVGDAINPLVNGMDIDDRGLMARVLSRVPPITYLNAASIEQLRATLPPRSSEAAAFAERYPGR